jgi:hypothetical protein
MDVPVVVYKAHHGSGNARKGKYAPTFPGKAME